MATARRPAPYRIVDGHQHHRRAVLQPVAGLPHVFAVAPERVEVDYGERGHAAGCLVVPNSVGTVVKC